LGTCRENSFCHLAIQQDDIFEIEDSTKDSRFSENEFVKGQHTPLTYYAGFPLKSPKGFNLGSLCVCDWKANKLNDKQRLNLKTLTEQVMAQLDVKTPLLELKKQNKKLIEANQRSEVLSKAKDEFISNVSHELRTPLNAINGYANILSQSILDKDQEQAVTIIKNSSEILITLVNDILDFSKINSDQIKLEKIPFNLKKTVKLVYDLLLNKAKEKNIKLEINYDEKIPKRLLGDKVRINQIIMNLVGNAIKFTKKGKVSIEVKLNTNELCETPLQNDLHNDSKVSFVKNLKNSSSFFINFWVRDTGIGIPQDKIDTIFERFVQAGTEITRKFGGTGLGLNISKNLVGLHGGKLKVKSVHGEGSEFFFSIPYNLLDVYSSTYKQNHISDLQKLNEEHFFKLAKLRVLVCEDNSVNIKLVKHLFKNKITYLEVVENGLIGIEMLKTKPFDVILMDLHMPEMDGIEATKYIRNVLKSKIPIIGFTANSSLEEKELCLRSGMNDYLTKTFVNNDIYKKLADVISKSKEYLEDEQEKFNIVNSPKEKMIKHKSEKCFSKNLLNIASESPNFFFKNKNLIVRRKRSNSNFIDIHTNPSKKIFSSLFKPYLKLELKYEKYSSSSCSEEDQHTATLIDKEILHYTSDQEIIYHVDMASLKEMSTDEDFNKEIIEYFIDNFPQELHSLKSDILENNKKQVKFKVHKMKTPLVMFGLNNLIEKFEKIEKLCNNNVNELAIIEYNYVDEKIKIILEELKDILNKTQ
jgi:signal transduction histidine kinase/DNA-binding response OmpR family regulator/HPt (histidine-containing phosphotransfer) domain-containing protein